MAPRVNSRGHIALATPARRAMTVQPGMVAVQVVVDDHLEVYFVPASHRRSLFGILPAQTPVMV